MSRCLSVATASHRVLASLVDVTLLLAAGEALARLLGEPNIIAGISIHLEGWRDALSLGGLRTAILLFSLSMGYFALDALWKSLGKAILHLENVGAERPLPWRPLSFALQKSLVVPALVDLFRSGRPASKGRSWWVVARCPPGPVRFVAAGFAVQILPLAFVLLSFLVVPSSATRITPPPSSGPASIGGPGQVWAFFAVNSGVLVSNVAGGLTLFGLNGRTVLTQSLIAGGLFADSLATFPNFLVFGVLPHAVLEFSAYALAHSAAMAVTYAFLLWGEAYLRGWSMKSIAPAWGRSFMTFFLTLTTAVATLALAAFVEVYVTSDLLNRFYYR